jgi:hypothetical protein
MKIIMFLGVENMAHRPNRKRDLHFAAAHSRSDITASLSGSTRLVFLSQ